MNSPDDLSFRLNLARGFLKEAEQDLTLHRWRSCVDNSQLSVENSGKAALSLFGILPKTHEPVRQVAALLRNETLPSVIRQLLEHILPDLLSFGQREHILTDYGDEETLTLPWDLFTQQSASDALETARRCQDTVIQLLQAVDNWRSAPSQDSEK